MKSEQGFEAFGKTCFFQKLGNSETVIGTSVQRSTCPIKTKFVRRGEIPSEPSSAHELTLGTAETEWKSRTVERSARSWDLTTLPCVLLKGWDWDFKNSKNTLPYISIEFFKNRERRF